MTFSKMYDGLCRAMGVSDSGQAISGGQQSAAPMRALLAATLANSAENAKVTSLVTPLIERRVNPDGLTQQMMALVDGTAELVERTHNARPRLTALVVDDDGTVREFMSYALGKRGVEVVTARSGEVGLTKLAERRFDIIFTDLNMPGLNGYDFCRAAKKDPVQKGVPVIIFTSRSSPLDKVRGTLAGCNAYLVKPVHESKLDAVLGRFVTGVMVA